MSKLAVAAYSSNLHPSISLELSDEIPYLHVDNVMGGCDIRAAGLKFTPVPLAAACHRAGDRGHAVLQGPIPPSGCPWMTLTRVRALLDPTFRNLDPYSLHFSATRDGSRNWSADDHVN